MQDQAPNHLTLRWSRASVVNGEGNPVPPNVEYVERIRAAAEQARRDGVGIYAPAGPLLESPREYRRRRVGTDQP